MNVHGNPIWRRLAAGAIGRALVPALFVAVAAGGCVTPAPDPDATVVVIRDRLEDDQSVPRYAMETEKALHGMGPGGWNRVLLGFRLPGSKVGSRDPRYVYWLHMSFRPGPGTRRFSAGPGQRAIYVELGRNPGDFNATTGVSVPEGVEKTWLAGDGVLETDGLDRDGRLEGTFKLTLTDGTKLVGEFDAKPGAAAITQFEKAFLAPFYGEFE